VAELDFSMELYRKGWKGGQTERQSSSIERQNNHQLRQCLLKDTMKINQGTILKAQIDEADHYQKES